MGPPPGSFAAMPDPGDVLIARVTGGTDRESFFASGQRGVAELERTLAVAGRTLDSFEAILDFGCGCGRMLLWLEELGAHTRLHGTDIDAEAIAWATAHIPYCEFKTNSSEPPLDYPDGAFDLVFNHSVFTHIDEERQDAWLAELQRVTRPGGLLVLSVHGEWALEAEWSEAHVRLEDRGHLFLPDMRPPEALGHPGWYASAFHAPWYVFERWGRWFSIRAYVPKAALGLQDHVLLERTTDGEARRPLAARPPRAPASAPAANTSTAQGSVRAIHARVGNGRSRLGAAGAWARSIVLRAMRPFTAHQSAVDLELARSLDALADASAEHSRRLDELERRDA
jgi:SAM-dependent methyltransferase